MIDYGPQNAQRKKLDECYQLFNAENMSNSEFETWIKNMVNAMVTYQQTKWGNAATEKLQKAESASKS